MSKWYECTVKYDKTDENGNIKETKDKSLVEAVSYTDAEARITKETEPYISGNFEVIGIVRKRIAEIFEENNPKADRWFISRVYFISYDEESGKDKRSLQIMYVKSDNIQGSLTLLSEKMKGTMADYVVSSLTETAIEEVYYAELTINKD